VEGTAAVDADVGRGGEEVGVVMVGDDALVVGVADGHAVGAGRRGVDGERERVRGAAADPGHHAAVGLAVAAGHPGRAGQAGVLGLVGARLSRTGGPGGHRGDRELVQGDRFPAPGHHDLVDAGAEVDPADLRRP
jgi:hypothetical protein